MRLRELGGGDWLVAALIEARRRHHHHRAAHRDGQVRATLGDEGADHFWSAHGPLGDRPTEFSTVGGVDGSLPLLTNIEFADAAVGYDRGQVDNFLRELSVKIGELQDMLRKATERAGAAERHAADVEAGAHVRRMTRSEPEPPGRRWAIASIRAWGEEADPSDERGRARDLDVVLADGFGLD